MSSGNKRESVEQIRLYYQGLKTNTIERRWKEMQGHKEMFQRSRKELPYVFPSTVQDSCLHDSTTGSVTTNDGAIAKAAAAVTHVQSQSQEVGSGDEGLGLLCFDLSSAETNF